MTILTAVIIFTIIALLVALIHSTKGHLTQAHWVLLFVGVALLTGIIFWSLGGSTGTFNLKEAGIELGGGAAIGAAFMWLAWKLVCSPKLQLFTQPYVVVDLPPEVRSQFKFILESSPEINRADLIKKGEQVLIEFGEGQKSGSFITKHLSKDGKQWVFFRHGVTRNSRRTVSSRMEGGN